MKAKIFEAKQGMSKAAAKEALKISTSTIKEKGKAVFIAATGASQFEFLENLTSMPSIDWSKMTMFHLDEYIGIPEIHPQVLEST
jgi:glucosamine-6-phosphate deaminase